VSRLTPPFPPLPPAARLGRLDLASVSRWFGALTGRGLRSLGFHLDFAPVVDLSRAGDEDGIGDRAYSDDPRQAASRAGEFLRGLAEARVAGCLKHFPGLGGAPGDTHLCLPRMGTDAAGLERALTPYRLLLAEAPMVMVAHAWYPMLSGNDPAPASLDRRIVTGLLRDDLGWQGITLCDDLEMGAVCPPADGAADAPRPFGDLAVAALAAGNDQVLVCQSAERVQAAHAAIRRAIASGDLDPAQSQASRERIERFRSGPACSRPDEPFDPGELDLVVDEMKNLIGEVDTALRRRGE
jgi:beta-N-acetylhexosaminidase